MGAGIVDALLGSPEPAVRFRVRTRVLGEDEGTPRNRGLRARIRTCPRARALLEGRVPRAYAKWKGAHWILAALADLGYPPGDASLRPLREQVLGVWLSPWYQREFEAAGRSAAYRGNKSGVPVIAGRHRQCGSLQGNALRSLTLLGFADERTAELAGLLRRWQWPDGGWNCDKNPTAAVSSFFETLLPMRGLVAHARAAGDTGAAGMASRAAEVFLQRRMVYRRRDGEIMRAEFTKLHHPLYWHYDVLGGLVGIAEAGLIADPRCADALDLLESRRLPDGGWPAERRFYRVTAAEGGASGGAGAESVDWGPTGSTRTNEWVTADALYVLRAAGRLTL